MGNEIPYIPPDMRKIYLRLRRWRSSHARRVPLPDSLWAEAGELAREHGINRTAKALHLEYGKLKERAEAAGPAKRLMRKARSEVPRRARPLAPTGRGKNCPNKRPNRSIKEVLGYPLVEDFRARLGEEA